MKRLFIHHVDLDGISCFILANHYKEQLDIEEFLIADYKDFENDENIFPWSKLDKNLFDEIVFADITPSEKCRIIIQEQNISCLILDHHKGIKEEIDNWIYDKKIYNFDEEKSGAKLVKEWIETICTIKPIVSEYSEIVSTYDLFKKESELWNTADSLNRLLYQTASYGEKIIYDKYKFFINTIEWKLQNQRNFSFSTLEESKIAQSKKAEDEIYNEFINKKREIKTRIDKKGRYFSIIKLNTKISAIASRLLDRYSKLSYIMVINEYDKEKIKISLRSKEINLLEYEGTAGHEKACGIENVTNEMAENLWNGKLFSLEIIKVPLDESNKVD